MTRISQLVSAVEAAFMDVDNLHFVHLVPHVRENSHGDSGVDNVAPALTAAHTQEIFRGGDSGAVLGTASSWMPHRASSSDVAAMRPGQASQAAFLSGVQLVQTPSIAWAHTQTAAGMRSGLCVGTPVTSIDQLYAQAVLLQPLLRLKVQQLAAASNGLVLVAPARSCFSCADCVCGVRHFVLALVGGASADALALVVGGEC